MDGKSSRSRSPLEVLLQLKPFSVNPLVSASDFVNFCKKKGLRTSSEQLEFYDKIGVFHPLLRFKWADLRVYSLDSQPWYSIRRSTGRPKQPDFLGLRLPNHVVLLDEKDLAVQLLDSGYIFDPDQTTFKPWPKIRGREMERRAESCYYSRFQIHQLKWVLSSITWSVDITDLPDVTEKKLADRSKRMQGYSRSSVEAARKHRAWTSRIVSVCQSISDRYFPQTQSDRRSLLITNSNPGWSWDEYCRRWDPHLAARLLQIDAEGLKQFHGRLSVDAQSFDPMEDWYQLVTYISVTAKEKLKGDASYAQFVYSMEHMIRLFYKDLTGESLCPPNESDTWRADNLYGEGVTASPLRHLYFLTNRFHLNPSPKLILVVEGEGEHEHIPRLLRAVIGANHEVVGIEICCLRGIGHAEGTNDEKYTALETFIDWHHSRNTIVMLMLDKEGRISSKVERLLQKQSIFTDGRMITKREYIKLWDPCIELECFTDEQLAVALTQVAPRDIGISASDVELFRKSDKPMPTLKQDFCSRTGYNDLPKKKLLGALVDAVIERLKAGASESSPLINFLDHASDIASRNIFPISTRHHRDLQMSGYYGDLVTPMEKTKQAENGP